MGCTAPEHATPLPRINARHANVCLHLVVSPTLFPRLRPVYWIGLPRIHEITPSPFGFRPRHFGTGTTPHAVIDRAIRVVWRRHEQFELNNPFGIKPSACRCHDSVV